MEILSLGEKIKRRRKELNMTLKDLAGDRITPGQISLVESSKSNPSMDLLEYLANTLNTSIEYLMESEETQAEKICSYFENMAEAFILNEDLTSAEQYIDNALLYTERYNLEYRGAKSTYLKGVINLRKGNIAVAQKFFLSSNLIFINHNSFENIINTFLKLGIIGLNVKTYAAALGHFKQAEKVFLDNDTGDEFIIGEIYYYIAYTYNQMDLKKDSMYYAKLSKEKFNHMDSKKDYAAALLNSSKEYSSKGDIENAIKYSKKTIKLFKELNDIAYLSEIENSLGKLFGEFEDYSESFLHLAKSKKLRQENNDEKIADTLINICENYIKLKDVNNANHSMQEIYSCIKEDSGMLRTKYYLLKYRLDILEGNLSEAEDTLKAALEFVSSLGYQKEQAEIAVTLGKFYIDYGQERKATEYLLRGVEVFKQLGTFKGFD